MYIDSYAKYNSCTQKTIIISISLKIVVAKTQKIMLSGNYVLRYSNRTVPENFLDISLEQSTILLEHLSCSILYSSEFSQSNFCD